jgi:predicted kinase
VDATHLSRGSRRKLFFSLGDSIRDVELIAIAMETPLEICLERNAAREGRARVPDSAIINMHKSYVTPSLDEGFNRIRIYPAYGMVKEIIKDGDN